MKKIIYSISIFIILIYIFINPAEAVEAAKSGLLLWFNVIIPNLLPFIILSNLIIKLNAASYITFIVYPFLKPLLGISKDGCYAVITGFFCGYPMGAKITSDLVSHQKVSKREGEYLLSFCNNVSPVFIINYIVNESFHSKELLIPVFLILYLSPVLCAAILNPFYRKDLNQKQPDWKETPDELIDFKIVDASIMDGFETITKLGGYIIIFALISRMLMHIPVNNEAVKCIIISLTEITNGISISASTAIDFGTKFVLILSCVSFGGLSCAAQTQSMIKNSSLSLPKYILSKLLNMLITSVLAIIYLTKL